MTLNRYPEGGYLPRVGDGVIHDEESDPGDIFKEETAGLSEHPAELLGSTSSVPESDPSSVMVEKMGLFDPECDRMLGRLFITAPLKNLVPDGSELPDPILHPRSTAVMEYNNPDLLPGMYPTLFPAGTGGLRFQTIGKRGEAL